MVRWIFARRLDGHSAARITRALNEAGIPCPSAADPGRNSHRAGTGWTLGAVATILANPRYTGRHLIVAHLPALHLLLTGPAQGQRRRRTRHGIDVRHQAAAGDVTGYLLEQQITLTYDPAAGTLHAEACDTTTTITLKAS